MDTFLSHFDTLLCLMDPSTIKGHFHWKDKFAGPGPMVSFINGFHYIIVVTRTGACQVSLTNLDEGLILQYNQQSYNWYSYDWNY